MRTDTLETLTKILKTLEEEYPAASTALRFQSPFQLLVAVMLSAQTTDKQVNQITADLFRHIKKPKDVLALKPAELEEMIKRCGLFRQKSRQLMETCRILVKTYHGQVPKTREELITLPGIGRKSANVIISTAFDTPAMAVDTHVMRVSRRLGLARGKTPLDVEEELCNLIPENLWTATHHRLISHGRAVCRARKPSCNTCSLASFCQYPD